MRRRGWLLRGASDGNRPSRERQRRRQAGRKVLERVSDHQNKFYVDNDCERAKRRKWFRKTNIIRWARKGYLLRTLVPGQPTSSRLLLITSKHQVLRGAAT